MPLYDVGGFGGGRWGGRFGGGGGASGGNDEKKQTHSIDAGHRNVYAVPLGLWGMHGSETQESILAPITQLSGGHNHPGVFGKGAQYVTEYARTITALLALAKETWKKGRQITVEALEQHIFSNIIMKSDHRSLANAINKVYKQWRENQKLHDFVEKFTERFEKLLKSLADEKSVKQRKMKKERRKLIIEKRKEMVEELEEIKKKVPQAEEVVAKFKDNENRSESEKISQKDKDEADKLIAKYKKMKVTSLPEIPQEDEPEQKYSLRAKYDMNGEIRLEIDAERIGKGNKAEEEEADKKKREAKAAADKRKNWPRSG